MRLYVFMIALVAVVVACGDNKTEPVIDLDAAVTSDCETSGTSEPQGTEPDAAVLSDSDDGVPACCKGLLEGNVPHECYPPPGTCRFDLVCLGWVRELCSATE